MVASSDCAKCEPDFAFENYRRAPSASLVESCQQNMRKRPLIDAAFILQRTLLKRLIAASRSQLQRAD